MYLMKIAQSPNCDICGTEEDLLHVLLECARNRELRQKLLRDLGSDRLNLFFKVHEALGLAQGEDFECVNRFFVRYPKIYEAIMEYGTEDWLEQYQYVYKIQTIILKELKEMSPKYFWRSKELGFEDVSPFYTLCVERNISLYCVYSILVDTHHRSGYIIESDYPSNTPYSLTIQYYATQVLRFITHVYYMMNWRAMTLTYKEICPERVLNFYGNWLETLRFVEYSAVKKTLDALAVEVIDELSSSHPVHSATQEERDSWVDDLPDNLWSSEQNRSVHSAVRHVLYTKRTIKIDQNTSAKSLDIIHVLAKKKGNMATVAVLYEALARRCGVKCTMVAFPEHFFLDWRESREQPTPAYRVDLITGKLEKRGNCPYSMGASTPRFPSYDAQLLVLSLNYEFRKALDHDRNATLILKAESLEEMFREQDLEMESRYRRKYVSLLMHDGITKMLTDVPMPSFRNLGEDFKRLMLEFSDPPIDNPIGYVRPTRTVYRNHRSSQVYFAVGMVCGHRMYNYTCVVTGWDTTCTASTTWQTRMGVAQLMYKAKQPFYNVYATDGTTRYVAQENLNLIVGQRQKIIEDVIGKEFSHFNGTYYIPNADKQKEFPDEQQVIAAYRRAPTLLMPSCKLTKPAPGHMQVFNWR